MASGFRATRLGIILLLAIVLAAFAVSRSATAVPGASPSSPTLVEQAPSHFNVGSSSRLSSRFGAGGVTLSVGSRSLLTLGLAAIGRGSAMRAVPNSERSFGRHSVSYQRAGVTQSYTSRSSGLEQVFTIRPRPAGAGALRLVVGTLAPGIHARVSGRNLTLLDPSGRVLATYGGLRVTDARGSLIPGVIRIDGDHVALMIDDHLARYPLRVDPYVQIATLTPSPFEAPLVLRHNDADTFGISVAESANGDVVVVGAPSNDSALVFVKPAHGGWQDAHPTIRLETPDQEQYPEVGESVAVSANGKTIVVGEPETTIGNNTQTGKALIYTEPSKGWSHSGGFPTAQLSQTDPGTYDYFGGAVAMDSGGDTILVGAPGWNNMEGAVYIFREASHGWVSEAEDASADVGESGGNSAYGGSFGQTLSMSSNGDVIAVGAPWQQGFEGAVYVFGRGLNGYRELADGASGTSDQYFTCGSSGYGVGNPELGNSVAVSSDGKTIAAGEPCAGTGGQAVVYTEPKQGWDTASGGITAGLTPLRPYVFNIRQLGISVAIAGNASTIVADDLYYTGSGGYVATFRIPSKGWSHVNPPVAANFGSLVTANSLANGLEDQTIGSPLAVSSGGGNVFVGTSGKDAEGAVEVYELASDIASATTVSCSPSSLDTGKSSTCTATVKTKSPTATGKVSFSSTGGSAAKFKDKSCTLKRVKTGTATCHVSFTPTKRMSYTITARYSGDNNHGSGSGTTVVDTPRDGTATKVSCIPSTVTATLQTACTATVTGVGSHAPPATFKLSPAMAIAEGQVSCAQQGSTETCTVDIVIAASGTYAVAASYPGTSVDGASEGSAQLIVAGALSSISGGCSPATIYADQTSTCNATVSGLVGTVTPPAISWTANATGWSFTGESCVVSGGAETCSATFHPGFVGSARISATFPGDASNLGSATEASVDVESTVVLSCTGTDSGPCTTTVTDYTTTPTSPSGTITLTGGLTGAQPGNLGSCTLQPISGSAASHCSIQVPHPGTDQYTYTASYGGDVVHKSGSATTTFQDPS
jgi:Bacterial Ig-like domain (group 3)/FG-GAP repeat